MLNKLAYYIKLALILAGCLGIAYLVAGACGIAIPAFVMHCLWIVFGVVFGVLLIEILLGLPGAPK